MTAIGILFLVGLVNPWLLLPILVLSVIFVKFRQFYLKTARDVKRLESTSKFSSSFFPIMLAWKKNRYNKNFSIYSSKPCIHSFILFIGWFNNFKSSSVRSHLPENIWRMPRRSQFGLVHVLINHTMVWNLARLDLRRLCCLRHLRLLRTSWM